MMKVSNVIQVSPLCSDGRIKVCVLLPLLQDADWLVGAVVFDAIQLENTEGINTH